MELKKTDSYAKAYVEILEIINHMGKEYRQKIPSKLLAFFEENKDINYSYKLEQQNDNGMQIFSNKTIGLLSMIETKYWAKENEKEILNNALVKNEKIYQELLREKYNVDDLFKKNNSRTNRTIESESINHDTQMVKYKETPFKRLINTLKNIFKK